MITEAALAKSAGAKGKLGDLKDKLLSAPTVPVLCHLNADTSWLLSLPYPSTPGRSQGRSRYNILIDPWFVGSQSDVASWFSTQYHAIPSSVQSVSALNDVLAEAETETSVPVDHDREASSTTSSVSSAANSATSNSPSSYHIDAVAISHEFTDHCHRATLEELPPSVPIFTTTKAAQLIQSWSYFTTVIDVPALTPTTDWRNTATSPLPPWLGISRLTTPGNSLYYHSALVFCLPQTTSSSPPPSPSHTPNHTASAIIYTPHGVSASTFSLLTSPNLSPPILTLALLHGLHDVSITLSKQLNLGAHNAYKAQKLLRPKYWVGTHDEVKKGLGLIGPLLRRKQWTVSDAVKRAAREEDGREGEREAERLPWVDLGNGESLVLE
jgi:hypothetical protein